MVAILVALAAPYALEWLPHTMPAEGQPCDDAPDRCAGLWSAECCDFSAPRNRFALSSDDSTKAAEHGSPAGAVTLPTFAPGVETRTASPPGSSIPDLRRHTVSSTVLRL